MFFDPQGARGAAGVESPAAARISRHFERVIGCRVIVGFPCPIIGEGSMIERTSAMLASESSSSLAMRR